MTEKAMPSSSQSSRPRSSSTPFSNDGNCGTVYQQTIDLAPRGSSTPTQDNPNVGDPRSSSPLDRTSEDSRLSFQDSASLGASNGSRTCVPNEQNTRPIGGDKHMPIDLSIPHSNDMDYPYFDANKHLEPQNSCINPEQDTAFPSLPVSAHLDTGTPEFPGSSSSATPIPGPQVLDPSQCAQPDAPAKMNEEDHPTEHFAPGLPPDFEDNHHPDSFTINNTRYHYTPSSAAASPNYVHSEFSEGSVSPDIRSSTSSNNTLSSDDEYDRYITALNHAFQQGQNVPDDSGNGNEGKLFQDCNPSTFELYRSAQGYQTSPDDIHDTKKFYLANDSYVLDELDQPPPPELNDIDFQDFYQESNSHFLPHITGGPLFQPINPNHIFPEDEDIYDDDDFDQNQETDPVGFTMHTDSMDPHFLNCVNPSIPEEVNSLAEAQQAVLHAVYGTLDSNGQVGPMPTIETRGTDREPSTSTEIPTNLRSQTVQEVLNGTSADSGVRRGMFVIPRIGKSIYVDGSNIAILEGSRPVKVFPRTPETAKYLQNFLLSNPFPWMFVLDPVVNAENQQVGPFFSSSSALNTTLLTDQEYDDLHRDTEYSLFYIQPSLILENFPPHIARLLLASPLAPPEAHTYINADGELQAAYESNLTVEQFIKQWLLRSQIPHTSLHMPQPFISISTEAANVLDWARPEKISRPESCREDVYDIQQIPWEEKLRVSRSDARSLRDQLYTAYRNLDHEPHWYSRQLPEREYYFREKNMYTKYKAAMAHFQLRNLMSVTSYNTVQYANRSKIFSAIPFHNEKHTLIDLSKPSSSTNFTEPVRISTMKAKHGVTVLGGFCGEYAMRANFTDFEMVEGTLTNNQNGITNHVDIVKHRTSQNPQAIFASNDKYIRVLDCETNKFVQEDKLYRAINCTDTSKDGRLRVVVGDAADAWVLEAETSKPIQPLRGHRDFGFACAWSPDMIHIATSNQDKTVNIWDARTWRILQTIESDVAGYRSLRFSPVGGGPRTLLMCEPADRISLVNAQTYQSRQVFDFFGEIGGADFSDDGSKIWLANMDGKFGGLMEFERCQWGQKFGLSHTNIREIQDRGDDYHPDLPNEWVTEIEIDDDERCVVNASERRMRHMMNFSSDEYDSFII